MPVPVSGLEAIPYVNAEQWHRFVNGEPVISGPCVRDYGFVAAALNGLAKVFRTIGDARVGLLPGSTTRTSSAECPSSAKGIRPPPGSDDVLVFVLAGHIDAEIGRKVFSSEEYPRRGKGDDEKNSSMNKIVPLRPFDLLFVKASCLQELRCTTPSTSTSKNSSSAGATASTASSSSAAFVLFEIPRRFDLADILAPLCYEQLLTKNLPPELDTLARTCYYKTADVDVNEKWQKNLPKLFEALLDCVVQKGAGAGGGEQAQQQAQLEDLVAEKLAAGSACTRASSSTGTQELAWKVLLLSDAGPMNCATAAVRLRNIVSMKILARENEGECVVLFSRPAGPASGGGERRRDALVLRFPDAESAQAFAGHKFVSVAAYCSGEKNDPTDVNLQRMGVLLLMFHKGLLQVFTNPA
eukprot:g11624.t1